MSGSEIFVYTALGSFLAISLIFSVLHLYRLKALSKDTDNRETVSQLIRIEARVDGIIKDAQSRDETIRREFKDNRSEIARSVELLSDTIRKIGKDQHEQQESLRNKLDEKMQELQTGNEKKLDQMRKTVDEHLQTSLEKRISESFKTVSDRLEAVHKGLGEMQALATGVGDLKRVLTNVKSRGTFGEVQLEALIADMLSSDQYVQNYDCGKMGKERVEYGVRLPGTDGPGANKSVYLPIDAKFPTEDYGRLLEAGEAGDREAVQNAGQALERAIRRFAADIKNKYINPPATTDWAILFLPTEGLYAEVLRRPGLFETLQRDMKVTIAGPTNIQVLLSTFRLGYRQVAMNERAQSVMHVLGAVRGEFEKYGDQIISLEKSLDTSRRHVDKLSTRRNVMLRALRDVETVEADSDSQAMIGFEEELTE